MPDMQTTVLSLDGVFQLAQAILQKAGLNDSDRDVLAEIVRKSEQDGPRSHGLRMLPAYLQSFTSGYANPNAKAVVKKLAPGVLHADGDNGYYQIAAQKARDELIDMTRENGVAVFTCSNCHHLAGLRFDTEALAEAGLVALAVVNSLSMVVPHGGVRPVYGTNPMSFACPREGKEPIVWDQAAAQVALMDVRMAAAEGHTLPRTGGLDGNGKPTTDPDAILESKCLLPFGEHKGSAIALLVEIMGAALAGGTLSIDNTDRVNHNALNIKGGNTLIAIDPNKFSNAAFNSYVSRICAEIEGNGDARIPGDGRLKNRARSMADGVQVDSQLLAQLEELAAA